MKVNLACVCAIVVSVACGSPRSPNPLPGAPDPIPASPAPPAPSTANGNLAGVVTAIGNSPASGVKVLVMGVDWPGNYVIESTATTDADGHYSMQDVKASAGSVWHLVGASRPGYFADFIWWMDFPKDEKFDLELKPWVHISLGQVVQGRIGDALCAGLGYGGWNGRSECQRFALTAPRSGTLEVTVSATDFNFDIDVVSPDGTFAAYASSSHSPALITFPAEGGSTYEIRVAGGWSTARDFTLTTRMP